MRIYSAERQALYAHPTMKKIQGMVCYKDPGPVPRMALSMVVVHYPRYMPVVQLAKGRFWIPEPQRIRKERIGWQKAVEIAKALVTLGMLEQSDYDLLVADHKALRETSDHQEAVQELERICKALGIPIPEVVAEDAKT